MKILLLTEGDIFPDLLQDLKQLLTSGCPNLIEHDTLSAGNLQKHQWSGAQMVVTVNLSGFEFTTLTGGISYNLWDTKFVHFLLGQNLRNERFLAGPLSISMFFYCIGQAYMDGLLEKYPDLPYLEKINGWQEGGTEDSARENARKMAAIIYRTARKCGLPLQLSLDLEAEFYFQQLKLDQKETLSALRHIGQVANNALASNDIPSLLSLIPYIESGKGKLAWEYKAEARRLYRILSIIYLETSYHLPPFCLGCESKEALLEKYLITLFALRRLHFSLSEKSKTEAGQFLRSANLSPFAIHLALQSELALSGMDMYQALETLYWSSWGENEKSLYGKLKESVGREPQYE